MPILPDQDRHFTSATDATSPSHMLGEGTVQRLLNARFIKGAITNGIAFEEKEITYVDGNHTQVFPGNITYGDLLEKGDVQLLIPFKTIHGVNLVLVVSGVILLVDTETWIAYDITPKDAYLNEYSRTTYPLSTLGNDNGVYGVGGHAVIFNYPNRPIIINYLGARVSDEKKFEIPPSRSGATVGGRLAVISGSNLLYISDPFGGASPLAPLSFTETFDTSVPQYLGQIFTIGSALDVPTVTGAFRLIQLMGPNNEFQSNNLLVSTENSKFIVPMSLPRDQWEFTNFIIFAGNSEGIAGPLAATNMGTILIFVTSTGRIKTISQEQEKDSALSETYFDENLGQYLGEGESRFYFRPWYRNLEHKYSQIKFNRDRLYVTVFPYFSPSVGVDGDMRTTPTHRALAVGSIDPLTKLGSQASITWEGFYDWIHPTSLAVLENDFYVLSKDTYGRNTLLKENFYSLDTHPSVIYTRSYLGGAGRSRTLQEGHLYFRTLACPIDIKIEQLINNKWEMCFVGTVVENIHRFTVKSAKRSNSPGIPLRIEIDHQGARFELESIQVQGEVFAEEKR